MLAHQMRSVYSDLFAINQIIHSSPDSEIKAAISRVTGKDELATTRMANTFKAFASHADFTTPAAPSVTVSNPPSEKIETPEPAPPASRAGPTEFHYNIQIVLPSTTEIAVYNAIFKSIKDNLGF